MTSDTFDEFIADVFAFAIDITVKTFNQLFPL